MYFSFGNSKYGKIEFVYKKYITISLNLQKRKYPITFLY